MAAKKNTVAKTKKQAVAVIPDFGADAGVGNDITMEDLKIPFVNLLQALSPQVIEAGDDYIEGAKPGLIINKATEELLTSMNLVLASRKRSFIEWRPNRGGFAGEHEPLSNVVKQAQATAVKRNKLLTKDGNSLEETFSLYAIQLDDDGNPLGYVVIPFTSTKIKAWRSYFTKLDTARSGSRKLTDVAPLFAMSATLTVRAETNNEGQPYFNFVLKPANGGVLESVIGPDSEGYNSAKALREAIELGRAKADYSTHDDAVAEEEVPF